MKNNLCVTYTAPRFSLLRGDSREEYENLHPLITKHTGIRYMDANPHANQNNFFHIALVLSVILFFTRDHGRDHYDLWIQGILCIRD